jgi:mannose-1-phosphate guanylyltransferase/mannose-6-phosphate isomerase
MEGYKITDFTIRFDATIIEALERINKNKRGFLVVVDPNQKALGTLSDGDLRRAFISIAQKGAVDLKGIRITDYYSKNFTSVSSEETLSRLIESFKNERINFIPILDPRQKLVNIITKKQMHLELICD